MKFTAKDLDENLRKMVAVGDLLRAAREELQAYSRGNAVGVDTPIPETVLTKVRAALTHYDEVSRFLASFRA